MLRYLLLLSGLLLLAGAPAFAQTAGRHARPDKTDDTIVLTLPDEDRALWQRAGRLLAQRGYPIRFASPELLTLTTEAIYHYDRNIMGIVLVVEGHELRLQAYIPRGSDDSGIVWFGIPKQDNGRGADGQRWQELEAVARLLGGTAQYTRSISY